MASILDRYGIKEVADVVFYEITDDGVGAPVLYLDSLKVSTLEQTGDLVYAQGGKGNARLIAWDTNKAITLTLEDALFSPKSMAIMFGSKDGKVDETTGTIKKTVQFVATANSTAPSTYINAAGVEVNWPTSSSVTYYDATGTSLTVDSIKKDDPYFATFDVSASGKIKTIEISPNQFPGTYYITGDTYARSEKTGKDECFQFIVHKGKITSANTITMQADGDPSTFTMTVECLRATSSDGKPVMIELKQYDLGNA